MTRGWQSLCRFLEKLAGGRKNVGGGQRATARQTAAGEILSVATNNADEASRIPEFVVYIFSLCS